MRILSACCVLIFTSALGAQEPPPEPAPELHISRATGPIEVDGALGDPGWSHASRIDTFYEITPGDNVEPNVKTVAWIAHDDRYFYAAFEFSDPDPKSIRAPFDDRDVVPSYTDYGGLILDTRNDGKSATLFLVNPRNIQYDAITSEASGEDSSPDFFWDSAARIGADGWTLEIRIPFSSLRYERADPQTWGIFLYRNRTRDFRYQIMTSKLPRGSNCFICHEAKLVGLQGLPAGNHVVLAPYTTGKQSRTPEGDLGSRLVDRGTDWDGGLDVKWTPNADTAIDATINPDFSQIESDVAQIAANERFALFYPEKRPFFLEGLDLFSTSIQAVYTRTITSPRWGARSTGQLGNTLYTVLVAEDRGGGSVILPGSDFSLLAPQDFSSRVAIGRVRRDFGGSFVSVLLTDREIEGGGHNRVLGPDFQWRPTGADSVRGQFLWGDTRTPDRPELAAEWNGQDLGSHAAYVNWDHGTPTWDWYLEYTDIGDDFRADLGFLPQVGVRDGYFQGGRAFYREAGLFRRIRPYLRARNTDDTDGDQVLRQIIPGIDFQGFWNSYMSLEHFSERLRAGTRLFDADYFVGSIQMSPPGVIAVAGLDFTVGESVDIDNERPGRGATMAMRFTIRPTDHLSLLLNGNRRWLDVSPTGTGPRDQRLFTADVGRIKATYNFSARAFLRLIGQWIRTEFDPDLYSFPVPRRDETFNGSALFAYKLNWQTVLFLGYGDDRALSMEERLEPARRELFFKISYAFQR
ncbi:MAG TPA: DUF5916 domain-containing protein [Thermoanaerobaculia bacterium]|nr:DUF5916 domain-containing protein [Thermoanaerobaculia bacterium]